LLARGFKPVRFNALQDQAVATAASNGEESAGNDAASHAPPGDGKYGAQARGRRHRRHR
jgi:hypothetical protein